MSRKYLKYYIIGFLALAGTALAFTQGKSGTAPDFQNLTDGQLLQETLNFSHFQVVMGELAVKQAAGREFKGYGMDMAAAHGQILRDIEKIAAARGMKLTPDIDPVRQNTVKYYSQEYGAAFDRNYISLMVDENGREADLFRHMARNSKDKDIREYAGRAAPALEGYAKRAKQILADLPFPFLK